MLPILIIFLSVFLYIFIARITYLVLWDIPDNASDDSCQVRAVFWPLTFGYYFIKLLFKLIVIPFDGGLQTALQKTGLIKRGLKSSTNPGLRDAGPEPSPIPEESRSSVSNVWPEEYTKTYPAPNPCMQTFSLHEYAKREPEVVEKKPNNRFEII